MADLFYLAKLKRRTSRDRRLPLEYMTNPLGPIHPGEILLEDFMKPLNLSAYRVAKDLGVAPLRITQIIHGKRAISAETALLLSRYTGTSPQFWINLQGQYDLEIVGSALSKKLAAINPVTMVSEALKQGPKGSRFASAGQDEKIHRRVALVRSKRVR
jgi:addiction module HigA family antidote